MTIRLSSLSMDVEAPEAGVPIKAARRLGVPPSLVAHWSIVRRAVDARGRGVRIVYTVDLDLSDPSLEADAIRGKRAEAVEIPELLEPISGDEEIRGRAVVVGCGPAGLFAALELARRGYRPLLIERGADVGQRHQDVARFHSERELDPDSNVLFGAGGAGTYSDGKLRTRIRDPRIRRILRMLVDAGAPASILVEARPHVGTDLLQGVVKTLCNELRQLGGEIAWHTRLSGLDIENEMLRAVMTSAEPLETNCAVLAMGGNARDTFEMLSNSGLAMEAKPFQMGLRVEHPRELIDRGLFGNLAGHPRLGAADYTLTAHPVTSFCVCPGGVIMAASAEPGTVCTNGMSNRARDGDFTNAALVTTLRPAEFGQAPLDGLAFQRRWETKGFEIGGGGFAAPAQNVRDFLTGRVAPLLRGSTYPFDVVSASMRDVLPAVVADAIASALKRFEQKICGFARGPGILVGPETRASCPVRMLRDPDGRDSVSVKGLFPAGEGAGYAGGIMSSAVDGLRSAEAVISRYAVPRH